MKKLTLFLLACVLSTSISLAQKSTGFSTSSDLLIGYKDDIVTTTIGYDFGYKIIPDLYFGVGPMVSASFGEGENFSAGGYGKVRYTVPLNTTIRPFIDARAGYSHSFSIKSGDMMYGAGLGVRIGKKFGVGICVNISTTSTTTKETYKSGTERVYSNALKKWVDKAVYSKRDIKKSKTNYTPALFCSFEF
ncbi:hypothetical protein [Bacteroides sp. 224]|uniref:hypothetical protein n=1 Tax=Bacteroides sp. 224 TaxID=2302936 RepID=UPI0013D29266|nr:hypothetical protein [Bacteroides sp. 224]NDV64160.1 hypothetical protein [Bacteroides sp. 224]